MIPTAEEVCNKQFFGFKGELWVGVHKAMIQFAQMHTEATKEQFKIVFSEISDPYPFEHNDLLEDVYPLTNIK